MKYTTRLFLIIVSVAAPYLISQPKEYVISDFGALADGLTNNSAKIQAAIDDASSKGGGRVVIPPGVFLSGTFILKSNVELFLSRGAWLIGSTNRNDYNGHDILALIISKGQENISVTGEGVIDGQAPELVKNIFILLQEGKLKDDQWEFKRPSEAVRPMLIRFVDCKKVNISGITLKNSAGWVQDYNKCSDLTINKIKVESTAYWNNDGIDITDCKNVKITNCSINSADDGICLKSEDAETFCDNVYVSDCTIRSSASAFKIGTASWGGFKNVKVRNLTVYDTYRSAVAIENVDGGVLENIDVENIRGKNTGNAIFIRLGNRNQVPGTIRNIRIADLKVEIPLRKPDLGYPFEGPPDYLRYRYRNSFKERPLLGYPFIGHPMFPYNLIPSSVVGLPGHKVQNVTLENIEITFGGAADKKVACISLDSLQNVPEKATDYPEFSMFGELPAWGFYVRHTSGITLKNVKMKFAENDFRPALTFDDADGIKLAEVEIQSAKEMPVILFNNTTGRQLEKINLPVSTEEGIRVQ